MSTMFSLRITRFFWRINELIQFIFHPLDSLFIPHSCPSFTLPQRPEDQHSFVSSTLGAQNEDSVSVVTRTTAASTLATQDTGNLSRRRELRISRIYCGREEVSVVHDERVIAAYLRHRKEQKTQERTERRALAS